jgi:hypothetical protein
MSAHNFGDLFDLSWSFEDELEPNPSDSPEPQSRSRSPKDTTEDERTRREERREENDAERRHEEKRRRRSRTQNLPVSYFAQANGLVTFALYMTAATISHGPDLRSTSTRKGTSVWHMKNLMGEVEKLEKRLIFTQSGAGMAGLVDRYGVWSVENGLGSISRISS